jgi:carbamoyltransferase
LLHTRTGCEHLVLTGGVALNSVCNGKILARTPFTSIFVPASPSDAGTAIGAALLAAEPGRTPQTEISPYLGPEFSQEEIDRAAARSGLPVESSSRPDLAVAQQIVEGAIVGWFQGRMEFGPRALGNRSILADPSRRPVRHCLNSLKGREDYRPFGISVQAHRAPEVCRGLRQSPRMMMVDALVDPSALGAVCHVDGTTRLHTVAPADNPTFYSLLGAVEAESGLPGVLNTSFNVGGEPIVCSPADALRTFATSELDALCMGNLIVTKAKVARDTRAGARVASLSGVLAR